MLVTVTVTPGSTAPVASVTVPRIEPRNSWAVTTAPRMATMTANSAASPLRANMQPPDSKGTGGTTVRRRGNTTCDFAVSTEKSNERMHRARLRQGYGGSADALRATAESEHVVLVSPL